MNFFQLINVKMPTVFLLINIEIANNCWHFNIYKQKNSILGLSEPKKLNFLILVNL